MSTGTRIGFVGTGRMGANMAQRLKDVGYTIAAVVNTRPANDGFAGNLNGMMANILKSVSKWPSYDLF